MRHICSALAERSDPLLSVGKLETAPTVPGGIYGQYRRNPRLLRLVSSPFCFEVLETVFDLIKYYIIRWSHLWYAKLVWAEITELPQQLSAHSLPWGGRFPRYVSQLQYSPIHRSYSYEIVPTICSCMEILV